MVKQRDYDLVDDRGMVIVMYDKLFPLYIVRGERNFLIDSGAAADAAAVHERIERVLVETGGEAQGIGALLLTHTHWDHTGAASYLQEKYGFDVIASPRGVDLLQKRKVVEIINKMNRDYEKMMDLEPGAAVESLQNLVKASDGSRIPVTDSDYFEVIETPGHTRCSLSYLLQPARILFPGDAAGLVDEDGSVKPVFFSSFAEYVQSLEKLISFEAEAICLAHNKFLKGAEKVKKHLQDGLDGAHKVRDLIQHYWNKEKDPDRTAEAVYDREFPRSTLFGTRETTLLSIKSLIEATKICPKG
jgi:glyoxylase-like metal-dependent hydrolase (beta-lactamase superfamily II)